MDLVDPFRELTLTFFNRRSLASCFCSNFNKIDFVKSATYGQIIQNLFDQNIDVAIMHNFHVVSFLLGVGNSQLTKIFNYQSGNTIKF
jgi:hypothetical protein